ncbi:S-adenosyl-L-methionine-dependent methyltransferase [Marasmius fiardii PR-910]|nr:S-adenosyl-L-methionine-dependent methyltransferase [Marasmius fiardii PR-910]
MAFTSYQDLSQYDQDILLVLPSDGIEGSEEEFFSVNISIDDIAGVISIFDEYHGRDPETQGKTGSSFPCNWALGLRFRAEFLIPLSDDGHPLQMPPKPRSPGVADFFCGAGGFSLGFFQAGWQIEIGVDSNLHACNTFKMNHPGADIHHARVENLLSELNGTHIYDPAPSCAVALISPPCQGFSSANPGGKNDG